nr:MAG TPA: hypothetical protein [Caudoviricetes sp.]
MNIDNFLFLKLVENSLYCSVPRLSTKLHVNCMPIPVFFAIPFICIRFLPYNAFKNFCFDIFAGFISISMRFFIFSICFFFIFIFLLYQIFPRLLSLCVNTL